MHTHTPLHTCTL